MISIDAESTGVDPCQDRIISLALVTPHRVYHQTYNPGRPVPKEVSELTGLYDADLADSPPFARDAQFVADLISGETLVGYNLRRFDVPLLAEEFERAGVEYTFGPLIDVDALFKQHHTRKLSDAVRVYLGVDHEGAHDALADAEATLRVYRAMTGGGFPALDGMSPAQVAALSAFGRQWADPHGKLCLIDGVVCFNTHRQRGVPVAQDPGYAEWMLGRDFPLATKRVLARELEKLDSTRSMF